MLFDHIIYGPIRSRRLGNSLGINLLPSNGKLCSFECVYCECGFADGIAHSVLPTVEDFHAALERRLTTLQEPLDSITFSGNGEPTMHPQFLQIMQHTVALRDAHAPAAQITVLSNSTQLSKQSVFDALQLCENRILKLDAGTDETLRLIDQPRTKNLTVQDIVSQLQRFRGDFILQTCFLRGTWHGQIIDNTTTHELCAWYDAVRATQPKKIMIYAIDRQTPVQTLEKISQEELEKIAKPLIESKIEVQISA